MQITGKIYRIDAEQQISEKFRKREFILEVEDAGYKQYLLLQCIQDRVDLLDQYTTGEMATCHINLKGRLWTNNDNVEKCFNSIECWRLEKQDATYSAESIANAAATHADEDEDLLPF